MSSLLDKGRKVMTTANQESCCYQSKSKKIKSISKNAMYYSEVF